MSVGSNIQKAFKALSIYDYFLAKKKFNSINKKHANAYASYGLAIIYSRNDNPFHNNDSAAKYAALSYFAYLKKPVKMQLSGYVIDSLSILNLCDSIATKNLNLVRKNLSVKTLDEYLKKNYLASSILLKNALYLRDELEFNKVIRQNRSDSTTVFINTHPESEFFQEALLFRQRQIYDESTVGGAASDFIAFIKLYPSNIMVNEAYENLFRLYKRQSNIQGLKEFVHSYPKAPQLNEAWKLLFSLSVKSFSDKELEKFLLEYPGFPFKSSIIKELELNKITLYPFQANELLGYIDTTGKIIIKPEYDAVGNFYEGLAVINKNDSVFYINKENVNQFNEIFSEAYRFKNGMAPVKKNNKWFFINRQGQIISAAYEEVNELSSQLYVVKQNGKYGAIDYLGQAVIEPKFQKLGDFKNDFAYYVENGKYGFVSKSGLVQEAEFEWISDFNEYYTAIVKKANHYGIINSQGAVVLEPEYDLVLRTAGNVFILVKNSMYGFYSGTGCFISPVVYDFLKEKPVEFYTNGTSYKLLHKNEQAMIDANGRITIDFGVYDEVHFASNGLLRVKRKNKFGYADRKLNLIIPFKYNEAGDFTDSVAIVKLKDNISLINVAGKEIYSSEDDIEKLSTNFYIVGDGNKDIINRKGEKVITNVKDIQILNQKLFILTLNNNEIKLLRD